MQQSNYSKLSKKQYIELNIRIQRSLILDFELASAHESAIEDWKIDIEREIVELKSKKNSHNQLAIIPEEEIDEPTKIEFERLSEFFFDLCLSWSQFLDIETFLFFLNGIFLNITKGSHVNVSVFKDIDEIEVLSIEFFNSLLHMRNNCEAIVSAGEPYRDWYSRNFSQSIEVIKSVEKQLYEAFKEREETRILDLWMQMPAQ
jgi:hypothetical protein